MSTVAVPGLWLPERPGSLVRLKRWWQARTPADVLVAALAVIGTPNFAAATSVTIPTHAVGDIIEIAAYRNGSNSIPTKPSASGTVPAWVTIEGSAGANTNSMIVCQFVATATNHTSGTWANATHMGAVVRRGQHATPIGSGPAQGGTSNSTGVIDLGLYGVTTLSVTDGTSAIDRWIGSKTVTVWGSAPTGWTILGTPLVSSGGIALLTKNSTTAESSSGTNFNNTFGSNGGFRSVGVETIAAAGGGGGGGGTSKTGNLIAF